MEGGKPLYKKSIFTVGAIHTSPVFFDTRTIKILYVILSEKIATRFWSRSFVEGVSRRRRSDTKPRSVSDEGISEQIWVACHNKCNIPLKSHRDSLRDPAAATPCASACSLRSTRRSSTALRMTYQILFGCFRLTLRKKTKTPQKGETKNATRRQSLQMFVVRRCSRQITQRLPCVKGAVSR